MNAPKLRCPACHQARGVNIRYGMPSQEGMEAAGRGEFALGGCCIPEDPPLHRCLACGHEWGHAAAGDAGPRR